MSFRHHDLDALRAVAMLLGIVLHAAMAFFDSPWHVQDEQRSMVLGFTTLAVHGFRMPLFFFMSGFFTMMLWHKRGTIGVLQQRGKRVLLPLLLGCVTIIPLTHWVEESAVKSSWQRTVSANPSHVTQQDNIWSAAHKGDLDALATHLRAGADPNTEDPQIGITPLSWAALGGQSKAAAYLIDAGAEVNDINQDGSTALHEATFAGEVAVAELLLQHEAKMDATDYHGNTPLSRTHTSWQHQHSRAKELQLEFHAMDVNHNRNAIVQMMHDYQTTGEVKGNNYNWWYMLTSQPMLTHLWFLWYLCLIVGAFALCIPLASRLRVTRCLSAVMFSPFRLLLLIPLTMLPQWFMTASGTSPSFGPDVSSVLLPPVYVICYYSIFFFFGAFYYDCDDRTGKVSRHWGITLIVAVLLVFPLGMLFGILRFGMLDDPLIEVVLEALSFIPAEVEHLLAVFTQAMFAWLMIFVLMGAFRQLMTRVSKAWRYLSDASYWFYLAHLPLTVAGQELMRTWQLPVAVKFSLLCLAITAIMFVSYHFLVRYSAVGTLLNGTRQRPPAKQITLCDEEAQATRVAS